MKRWKWFLFFSVIALVGCSAYLYYRIPPDMQSMGDDDLTAKIGFYAAIVGAIGATIDLIGKIIEMFRKK